jgi:quinol monooxygenase YgiN
MICVIASIELGEGCRDNFLTEFRRLVPKVLAENGCIEYAPMIDVATGIGVQLPVRPSVVTIVEKWEGTDALEAHLMTPHMTEYRKAVKNLVLGTKIQILAPA